MRQDLLDLTAHRAQASLARPAFEAELILPAGPPPVPRHPPSSSRIDWSLLPPPAPTLRCVVVIPVRNEAALLPRTLRALAEQVGVPDGCFEVLVLANNCSDATASRGRNAALSLMLMGRRVPIHVVEVAWPRRRANVGGARRALMDEAARRIARVKRHDGVILSTDGDTRVDPDWLAATLAAIDAGADAVGGRILTETEVGWPAGMVRLQRLDHAYLLLRSRLESLIDPDASDPWPRHHQHFGASLAVRADVYRRIGGLPRVPHLEDAALYHALRRRDLRVRHCPRVRVWTSGRFDGRCEVGLAHQLRIWADQTSEQCEPYVMDPAAEQREWLLRSATRQAWQQCHKGRSDPQALTVLARGLRIARAWVQTELEVDRPFGELWETIGGRRPVDRSRRVGVPLSVAAARFRELIQRCEEASSTSASPVRSAAEVELTSHLSPGGGISATR